MGGERGANLRKMAVTPQALLQVSRSLPHWMLTKCVEVGHHVSWYHRSGISYPSHIEMKHHWIAIHKTLKLGPTLLDICDAFLKLSNLLRISSPQLSAGLDSECGFVNWLLGTLNILCHWNSGTLQWLVSQHSPESIAEVFCFITST